MDSIDFDNDPMNQTMPEKLIKNDRPLSFEFDYEESKDQK